MKGPGEDSDQEQDVEGVRKEPWRLIPIFGITEAVNILLFLSLAVVPFYTGPLHSRALTSAADYPPFSWELVGIILLGLAGFEATFGRLLHLAMLGSLLLLIPAGWRALSRAERVMWPAVLFLGVLVSVLTYPQWDPIQRWVLD